MSQESSGALAIKLDDGRTVIATPRPEDQGWLEQLGADTVTVSAGSAELDTYGHGISDELTIDVEGHALTLRLPTPADAEALRKALAVGVVSATIIAAGAIAAMQGGPTASSTQTTVEQPAAPAQAVDLATLREQRVIDAEAVPGVPPGSATTETERQQDTRENRSGPLEFDR